MNRRSSLRSGATCPKRSSDQGAMITVTDGDGVGYAATTDLSEHGLKDAAQRATQWARTMRGRSVFDGRPPQFPVTEGFSATTPSGQDWTPAERIDRLRTESEACRLDERIVDWRAGIRTVRSRQLLAALDGAEIYQEH